MEIREGYKKTEVGIIPEDWDVYEVQDAYDICNNLRYPISEKERKEMQGKYPYYGPTKIQDYISGYRLDGEYALIGEDGDHFLKWLNMPMTLLATGKFNVNNHAHVVKGIKNETKWFYWYFNHRDITPYLSRQGAGRYKLNKGTLRTIKMAIPSQPEQQAIATSLSDIDNLINSLTKLIDKKKNILQGAMQELLTGRKRLEGFSGEWEEVKLGDIAEITMGQSPDSKFYNNDNEGLPLVQGNADIDNRRTIIRNYTSHITKRAKQGDIIMTVRAPVGYIGKALYNCCIGRGVCSIKYTNEYLYHYLVYIEKDWVTLSKGSTFDSINSTEVNELKLIMPSHFTEQSAIANILSDMDTEIEALEQKLNKYKNIKQGMRQELLTGRIRLLEEVV